jgi:hypothetical protein
VAGDGGLIQPGVHQRGFQPFVVFQRPTMPPVYFQQ